MNLKVMKKILWKILLIFILTFWVFIINTNAWFFNDLFWLNEVKVPVDCGPQECNINGGILNVKYAIIGIIYDRTFSEYIQDVVAYLLTFTSFVAVIYIIYAWFRILTGAGQEEVLKKQKLTILYVAIWMIVIWLAYPITIFIINALNS